jgi:hypothetical protein
MHNDEAAKHYALNNRLSTLYYYTSATTYGLISQNSLHPSSMYLPAAGCYRPAYSGRDDHEKERLTALALENIFKIASCRAGKAHQRSGTAHGRHVAWFLDLG